MYKPVCRWACAHVSLGVHPHGHVCAWVCTCACVGVHVCTPACLFAMSGPFAGKETHMAAFSVPEDSDPLGEGPQSSGGALKPPMLAPSCHTSVSPVRLLLAPAAEGPCLNGTSGLPCAKDPRLMHFRRTENTVSLPSSVIFPCGFHFLLSGGRNSWDGLSLAEKPLSPLRSPQGLHGHAHPVEVCFLLERLCTWVNLALNASSLRSPWARRPTPCSTVSWK